MNYPDGQKMMVGDRLKLWDCCYGTVVYSIEHGEYTPEHSQDSWAYLKTGVLINSSQTGLIRLNKANVQAYRRRLAAKYR